MPYRSPLFALALLPAGLPAAAQTAIGEFDHWMAVADPRGGGKVCYAIAKPTDMKPDNVKRGDVWVLVTHRPKDKVKDEVRVIEGYPLAAGSKVTVDIGGQPVQLFVDGEDAWAESPADDQKMVQAMKKGSTMTVEGASQRGTKTTDTYSLGGFTAAYTAIGKACGVE